MKSRPLWISRTMAVVLLVATALVAGEPATSAPASAAAPSAPPAGLTAIALDGRVTLAWQAAPGAATYAVYRGSSPSSVTQLVSPAGLSATRFTDTAAANGSTQYYVVRAQNADGASGDSQIAQATPRGRSCSSGNAIRVENCFPGTTAWKTTNATRGFDNGIDGFLSSSSVDAGASVDLRVQLDWTKPYRVEIYRTGGYGGAQGRLISTIRGLTGEWPPSCIGDQSLGLSDCSRWTVATTITTTSDWVSGVYLLKLVREDNGAHNEVLLVVRDDGSTSDLLYHVPTSTYQAYNNFNGKSLYSGMSDPPNTVTGTTRAVKVSFDRPYTQPPAPPSRHDWYTRTDVANVGWLEQQGYDITYFASEDMHADGAQVRRHRALILGSHDEYWSQAMFDAARSARDAGTSLLFFGANSAYWRVRFEAGSGRPNRVMVGYKTIEGGPADPSGSPTTTWRDPSGPNLPENSLIGQMYIGENLGDDFPLRVSAAEGRSPVWRHTSLADLAPGASESIGTAIVGWEWDARVANGREPAGVTTVASTPVDGNLIQGNGASQARGTAIAMATRYEASSGAVVFATGTNNWWRGLGRNVHDQGEPTTKIQQATLNVLADMGARPTTPASGLVLDPSGAPTVTATSPASGATGVSPTASFSATFDRDIDPSTVTPAAFTVTGPDGSALAGTVTLDDASRTVTFDPAASLAASATYTARAGSGLRSWSGEAATPRTWSFSTGTGSGGAPPSVISRVPAVDATAVATDTTVRATFSRPLDPGTVTPATFTVRPAAGGAAVAAAVSYNDASETAQLVPAQPLAESTRYTAELGTGIEASDGTAMAAAVAWSFTTGTNLRVTDRTPAPGATGVAPATVVRAVFSRAVDGPTVTAARFTLRDGAGQPVTAQVAYDSASRTATLTPAAPLAASTTFTATVGGDIRAADGAPLEASTWSFTTGAAPPAPPAVSNLAPAIDANGVPTDTTVRATFDRSLDPASVTSQTFTLSTSSGASVAAEVSYDDAARRATLTPLAALAPGARYTATLTTGIRSAAGTPLAASVTWSFTTAGCPCRLFTDPDPAITFQGVSTANGRGGAGPWSLELGVKIQVTEASDLLAVRYYRDPGETGTHVGRVWSSAGALLASTTFTGESSSGWQQQALASPLRLAPGQTYVVSVGANARFGHTPGGLATQVVSGPLRSVADGANGVFSDAAGTFPAETWNSSNYHVDAVVDEAGTQAQVPQVTGRSPAAGATGVDVGSNVTATFNVPLNTSTVNTTTFTLTDAEGALVSAPVSYDGGSRTATLDPSAALEPGAGYTARLSTGIRSTDGSPMAQAVSWTFTTLSAASPAPTVTATSPVDGATGINPESAVTATFSQAMDAATLASSFTLTTPSGTTVPASVTYNATSRTATLTPTAPLLGSTAYLARIGTAARSAAGVALEQPVQWGFTTSACPCRLFTDPDPEITHRGVSTSNGRGGAGPWTLELGVKLQVTSAARLTAVRYHRDPGETGTHTGRIWSSTGTLLASVAFTGESASGWQQQALASPLNLVPGQTYVVSVGFNARFGHSPGGLATQVVSGPLRSVADGANGVFSEAAGTFPSDTWNSSNYHLDAVVE